MTDERGQTGSPRTPPAPPADAADDRARIGRRDFLRSLVGNTARAGIGVTLVLGLLGVRKGRGAHAGTRGNLGIVRPPGSRNEQELLERCIRCTRCADACPTQCILLFGPEAGALHGTPYIITADRACTMCLLCGEACPTEAIDAITRREQVAMGVAVVDERLCVSHNGTGVCGACHTACPLRNIAITQNLRNAPVVHPEHCTGCGMCEELCIVRDRRAIQVVTGRNTAAGMRTRGIL